MPVEVRYYTDPASAWSWAAEPSVRRLMWEFGDGLRFRWVMGGLARQFGDDYRDETAGVDGERRWQDAMAAHWLDVAGRTGMPIDPRIWIRSPIATTYPACLAVTAASEQGPERAYPYLRRLREGLMLERRKLDHVEALVAEAGPAGLDVDRFRIDVASNAITEGFAADLDEVRNPPDEAREAGGVTRSEGRERIALPSAVFVAEDGTRHGVWGPAPYDDYRAAALAAGAQEARDAPPGAVEAVERFGRATTPEVEALTGQPALVVRAELWDAARDWRLRAVPVLGGEVWEPAGAAS